MSSGAARSDLRARVVAHGRVQGVAFRFWTAKRALQEGVRGFVRNRPDGTVEAVFEGEATAVRVLVDLVRRGPDAAHVARLDVCFEPAVGEFVEFRIVD